ncbi:DEAD/DEAH box helicase [Comamonas testosteroni]|uniref:DEAD/DEAH box helicase n=1 Tax=Comamonas testosteroni TaxID=285 RepID=UPI00265E6C29|nr:DEAD/DEAH box helicase [Comamonas testosteroni]WKL16767.1 DEAD/DEAH box helicase [Comamonas testosteroni]WQD44756.1 DEAD/DEAH box helicase [Comamonas testosteroni]
MTFEELNLAPAILKAVQEQGYENPTPIQAQAIPLVLAGHDLLAGAQTGTGKTAAFTLPMLQRLASGTAPKNKFGGKGVRTLVLTPTRELAAQVEENLRGYAKYLDITSTVIFGGVGMKPQIARIEKGVDVLVATPGRLLDLAGQGFMDLSTVEMLILDEADRMLDMGFIHDVKKVLALVPKDKQSLLFSATFSDEIRELANGLLRNPQSIQVTPRNTTVQRIKQVIHPVGRGKKKQVLLHIIQENNWSQVLVFTRTKFGANNVAEYLTKNGVSAMALHGNKSQSARTQALEGFKTGELRALVATDIAARGIDIDELPNVVNYEIPNISEDYVHRIGRTGRAGREGNAVSLVCMDEEGFMMDIERFTKQEIPVQPIEGFGPEEGEIAEPIAMGRQTLWGGAGKPPSRDVMQAAAKAARQEMMERIRSNKTPNGSRSGRRPAADAPQGETEGEALQRPARQHKPRSNSRVNNQRGQGQQAVERGERNSDRSTERNGERSNSFGQSDRAPRPQGNSDQQRAPKRGSARQFGDRERGNRYDDQPPRADAHLGTQQGHARLNGARGSNGGGQPDPMRTSVDSMADRGRRGGFGGGGGGRGGFGGGNRGGNRGGFGGGYGR